MNLKLNLYNSRACAMLHQLQDLKNHRVLKSNTQQIYSFKYVSPPLHAHQTFTQSPNTGDSLPSEAGLLSFNNFFPLG